MIALAIGLLAGTALVLLAAIMVGGWLEAVEADYQKTVDEWRRR